MHSPEDLPVEEKSDAKAWPTAEKDDIVSDQIQTLGTIGLFAAVIIAFLGICLPLFLL